MKAKVNTKALKLALAKLASLPGGNSGLSGTSIAVIEADEFGGLRVTRTTVHAFIRITCEAEIEESGKAIVPYMGLAKFMEYCDGADTEMTLTPKALKLESGGDKGEVFLWPENEVIAEPKPLEGVELCLEHDELIKTLKITSAAAADDRSRPQFMGVCFRKTEGALSVIGCNGHRAHVARLPALVGQIDPEPGGKRDYGVLVPSDGVDCVLRVFADEKSPCMLTLGKDGVQFDAGDITLRLPVSDHRMSWVDHMLSAEPEIKFRVNRKAMLEATRAIAAVSGDSSVAFSINRDTMHVTASSVAGRKGRHVKCEADGSGSYVVESKYLSAMLQCAELENLDMWITGKGQRLYYREGERDFLVMFRAGARKV